MSEVEPEMKFLDRIIDYCQEMRYQVGRSILDDIGAMCRGRKKKLEASPKKKPCKNLIYTGLKWNKFASSKPCGSGGYLCDECKTTDNITYTPLSKEEKFHLDLTKIITDCITGDINSGTAFGMIEDLDVEYLKDPHNVACTPECECCRCIDAKDGEE